MYTFLRAEIQEFRLFKVKLDGNIKKDANGGIRNPRQYLCLTDACLVISVDRE